MKYYVWDMWKTEGYVEMTLEEITEKYGENIAQGEEGVLVLTLSRVEKDALYFCYCEFEC